MRDVVGIGDLFAWRELREEFAAQLDGEEVGLAGDFYRSCNWPDDLVLRVAAIGAPLHDHTVRLFLVDVRGTVDHPDSPGSAIVVLRVADERIIDSEAGDVGELQ